jgi:hypothetical protein
MLNGRALVTAAGAPRPLPQHVARRGGGPADEGDRACQRRVMLAALAVKTQPRRRAVQVADRGWSRGVFMGGNRRPATGRVSGPERGPMSPAAREKLHRTPTPPLSQGDIPAQRAAKSKPKNT